MRGSQPPEPRMPRELQISIGQFSGKGAKETNQDFHGALIPGEPLLSLKGISIAIADGISSSAVGGVASESAVKSFLTDYYCTPDSWSVATSAQRVLAAANSWLHAQNRRGQNPYDMDKGYVCTFTALILKAAGAHIFHVGDARVYRLSGGSLEQLTNDHRVTVSAEQHYLGRALGVNPQIEIDYRTLNTAAGDVFILATDGVYEHAGARFIAGAVNRGGDDLDAAAKAIAAEAARLGSPDNLTVQIVRIDGVPEGEASDVFGRLSELPLPPLLEPRMVFDGYTIIRGLHGSSRSHIYLARDSAGGALVSLKIPSIDLRGDTSYLKRFMMEEWVARRIDSAHVLKPSPNSRRRNFLYVVTEFIDGQTLTQWMIDNPTPDLETIRGIAEQIARGLRAFHRMEMLHQDLRPDNIMIDKTGTVKIIDFGSARISGVAEAAPDGGEMLGTLQYSAPEYFLGGPGSARSDLFSLGVITYQMLTGRLPYGAQVAKARTKSQQGKLRYRTALDDNRDIPAWIDGALERAVRADPWKRYGELSEFISDLRRPNEDYLNASGKSLLDRDPAAFWKYLSFAFAAVIVAMLILAGVHR